jgi:hypothetical protein
MRVILAKPLPTRSRGAKIAGRGELTQEVG